MEIFVILSGDGKRKTKPIKADFKPSGIRLDCRPYSVFNSNQSTRRYFRERQL